MWRRFGLICGGDLDLYVAAIWWLYLGESGGESRLVFPRDFGGSEYCRRVSEEDDEYLSSIEEYFPLLLLHLLLLL